MIKIIRLGYIFSPSLIVLAYQSSTLDPVAVPRFLVFAVVTLFLLFTFFFIDKPLNTSYYKNISFIGLTLYVLLSWLSLWKVTNPNENLYELIRISVWFIYISLSIYLFSHGIISIVILSKGFLFAILLSLIFGIVNFFQIYKSGNFDTFIKDSYYSVTGLMANRNLFASGILLTIPFISIYYIFSIDKFVRFLIKFVFLLIIIIIILLQVRTVWLAVFLSLITFFTLIVIFKNNLLSYFNKTYIYLSILVVIICLYMMYTSSRLEIAYSRISEVFDTDIVLNEELSTSKERLMLWKETVNNYFVNGWSGHGIGSWRINTIPLVKKFLGYKKNGVYFQRPHNDFIWILYEVGLGGLIAFLLIITGSFINIFRNINKGTSDQIFYIGLFLIIGITFYVIEAFFSFPKERPYHTLLLANLIICASTYNRKEENNPVFLKNVKPIKVFLVGFMIYALYIAWNRYQGEIYTKKMIEAYKVGQWQNVLNFYNKSQSKYYNVDVFSTPILWYRATAYFAMEDLDNAKNDFESALKFNPYHIHTLNDLASCNVMKGEYQTAISLYKKCLDIEPRLEDTKLNLAVTYYNMGDYKNSLDIINTCILDSTNERQMYIRYKILKTQAQAHL